MNAKEFIRDKAESIRRTVEKFLGEEKSYRFIARILREVADEFQKRAETK
jgi:hypothetical protein